MSHQQKVWLWVIAYQDPSHNQTDLLVEVLELTPSRLAPTHFIIKLSKSKDRERLLNVARKKQLIIYLGILIRLSSSFSSATFQARREWYDIFKILRGKKNLPIRNTLSDKVLLHNWRRDKEFSRQKLKTSSSLAFKKLKGFFQAETKTLISNRKPKQNYNSSVKVNISLSPEYANVIIVVNR